MIGISSVGVYIPLWRLSRNVLTKGMAGEKAVANWDEDSITMAVAAAINCLNGAERQAIDGLFFASTTSSYKEKQASTLVATAVDLRRDLITTDLTNSLRAGTTGMKLALDVIRAGSAKQIVVVAVDNRLGAPGSSFEQICGDGAAALLIGDSNVAATLEASYSISNEMLDVWRADGDTFVRMWEERFVVNEGYLSIVAETVSELLRRTNLTVKDFAKIVFYAPDERRYVEVARSLGFDIKTQLIDPLSATMGNTGTAYPLMLLVEALEEAKPGDRILLVGYGDGCDAFVLRATEDIEKLGKRQEVKRQLGLKKMVPSYDTYLQWRGLLKKEGPRRPRVEEPSATGLWRERDTNLRLHGVKCQACGAIQFPPQRVCIKCHTQDRFDVVRFSNKKGRVFTFSLEYPSAILDVPIVTTIVDFQGGGRASFMMTDRDLDEVKIGLPVELTFRKLFVEGGVHNYYWKCRPIR